MHRISIIEAPLVNEQYESGIAQLPRALKKAGLHRRIKAKAITKLPIPNWKPHRDPITHILNPLEVRDYTIALADAIEIDITKKYFPVVLGGDCTILLGCLLALQRRGTSGLFFIDGHADFYQPKASPSGETADMDLALAVGKGPQILAAPENKKPLVKESNVILFGFRDEELMRQAGGRDVRQSNIGCFSLADIRDIGFNNATGKGIETLTSRVDSFWVHFDVDALDDSIMPAVDYRMPGGLSWGELISTLRRLFQTQKALGLSVSIFNPSLDWNGSLAKKLTAALVAALKEDNRYSLKR